MTMVTLGARLRSERCRLGLSQRALAEIGGVKTNAQGHYEQGLRLPRADYLAMVHSVGVDVVYVLVGINTEPRTHESLLHRWHP